MCNPKRWRERSIEKVRFKLDALKRKALFEELSKDSEEIKARKTDQEIIARFIRCFGLNPSPNMRKRIRRLARKIRRMENNTYRRGNKSR